MTATHRAAYPEFADRLVGRWVERDPGWLSLSVAGVGPIERPVASLVHATALDRRAEAREIPVMVADFVSPVWREPRLPASLRWVEAATILTAPDDVRQAAALHLRAGGIIAIFGWPAPDTEPAPPSISALAPPRPPAAEFWIEGDHGWWLAQRRMAVRSLQLYGHTAHIDRRAGDEMVPLVVELWDGLFSWHVDVSREVARGLDMFRYTQASFDDAAAQTVSWCVARLADAGVRSRGVLLA